MSAKRQGRQGVIRRVVVAMRVLQTNRYTTIDQLAQALGASERTAYRYLAAIETHVPIHRNGPHYRIRESA